MRAKEAIRLVTPPVLWQAAGRLRPARPSPTRTLQGPFPSWAEAEAHSEGWDQPNITEKMLDAALRVLDGLAPMERDGVIRDRIIYSQTILAFLILALSRGDESIVDFGGGLGSNYFQNARLLRNC